MKARGKILRVSDSGTGLLMIDGRQFMFSIDLTWRSKIPPKCGMAVEVEFDKNLHVAGVTPVGESPTPREDSLSRRIRRIFPRMLSCVALLTTLGGFETASAQNVWLKIEPAVQQAAQQSGPCGTALISEDTHEIDF